MEKRLIDIDSVKSVLRKVGIKPEECDQCMGWTSPQLDQPLTGKDKVLAELTTEEQGFFRCMNYTYEEKVMDTLRLTALHQTFWITVRSLHNLPSSNLTVKGGKYVVAV
jgi:hypothetical protein